MSEPLDATPVKKENSEYHLFILWETARGHEARILEDIRGKFDIVAVREVHWTAERASSNFSRFYGQKLPPGSFKEEHCGKGPFLAILVHDPRPSYENRQTSKGGRSVNTNMFDAKQIHRQWTGGGHRVHATDTENETRHDVALLFGTTLDHFIASLPRTWDGRVESLKADLAGADGWRNLREFFTVLNDTVRYLVLRNFAGLPDNHDTQEHGDIDLLTDAPEELALVANGEKVFPETHRVHFAVKIAGQRVLFDFRFAGDDYYARPWQEDMLSRRVRLPAGIYAPAAEDHFYSLLYHALIHKRTVGADYIRSLRTLGAELGLDWTRDLSFANARVWRGALEHWLREKGYLVVRPADTSVFFNEDILEGSFEWEAIHGGLPLAGKLEHLISARVLAEHEGRRHFSYVFHEAGSDRVIKQASGDLAWRDAKFLQQLTGTFFPRGISAEQHEGWSLAAIERIEGESLRQAAKEITAAPRRLAQFFRDCLDLLEQLQTAGITHRDIRADNLLVCNGRPVLIDFGWAISATQPIWTPDGLCEEGRPDDGVHCDVFAMGKVFEKLLPDGDQAFAPLLALMTAQDPSARVTNIPTLKLALENAPLRSVSTAATTGKITAADANAEEVQLILKSLPGPKLLEVFPVRTRSEFDQLYRNKLGRVLDSQSRLVPKTQKPFLLPGHCVVCGGKRQFMTDFVNAAPDAKGSLQPSWRERQVCGCKLNSRQRACFHVVAEGLGLSETARIYCTEQTSGLFEKIKNRFSFAQGSEFLGETVPPGLQDYRGVRNEDITRLTFPDEAFDCIVCLEVLQHVADYAGALAELARCLKPGGILLLTTPLHFKQDKNVVRTSFGADGKFTHHFPTVYHGDPAKDRGVLCFHDFGWDLLEEMRRAGFTGPTVNFFTSQDYGYLGTHTVILATRESVLAKHFGPQPVVAPVRQNEIIPAAPAAPSPEGESTESLLVRAESLRQQSQWLEAGQIYQNLNRRLPHDLSVWRGRIECSRQLGHKVLLNLLVKDALRSHPEWAAELNALAAAENRLAEAEEVKNNGGQTPDARQAASEAMKRDWNVRAAENARYHVRSSTRDQSEEEFDASGMENVSHSVISDLPRIAGKRDPKTLTMLEIGCGLGRMTKHFARHFRHVHAVDVSGEMIRQARERLKALPNVSLEETTGTDLSLLRDATVDFVFSFIVFQHIPNRAVILNYIREAHRVLRPGGVFKFQVQGCVEKSWMETPKDTWNGVTITEQDIADMRDELGFDLLAKSGQGTQYSWYTLRKPAHIIAPLSEAANPPTLVPDASSQAEPPAATAAETENRVAGPTVSVIIPVLNKIDLTRKCLEAVRQNTPAGLCEVIVWDNASTDGTQSFFQEQSASDSAVRYFRSEENLGFVGGNNAATQHARGRYIVFLNNDTEPKPGWLEALVQTIEADPGIGAVGAKLIYPHGKLQEAGGIIFRDASGWNYGRTQDPRDPRFNFPREVDYCSAACLLVRAELFRQLGGFDTRYAPAYYEDTDLCFALRQAGYKVLYQPRCEIIHYEGATAGQDLTKGFKQYQVINRQKFFTKWEQVLAQQPAPDASLVRRASHRVRGQRILVVDPMMPMHDRASGSKRLFEMLKLLAAAGHAVTFVARNGQNGERYAVELQQLGIEVYAGDVERMKECGFAVQCWPLDLKKLLQESRYDTVILSFWYIAEQYLSRIRAWSPTSRVLIDTVDVHFLRERRQAELYHDQKMLRQAVDTYRRELRIYAQADALITVTEDDRQTLLRELPQSRIFIVPNIHELAGSVPPVESREGLLFVGGFGHLPNEDAVLYFHREIWPRVHQRVPGMRCTIVGNNPPASVKALAGPSIQITGYVPNVEPYLQSHLISIAPLRYGAGMKGKIGEALAHGLPVVTTSIGAEGMSLKNGGNGTLVSDDPEAFADHIAKLYTDRELWNQLSAEGRRHIETNFTPQRIGQQLGILLEWSASFTSIIILAHNQLNDTRQCLASIEQNTRLPHELILVDNNSTDGTTDFFRQYAVTRNHVRLILNRENHGFAGGNNQALAIARGENVLLLNNDTVVPAGWLERLLEVFKRHPEAGLAGPVSNSVSGPQRIKADYTSLETMPEFAALWSEAHTAESTEAARLVGFCLLFRRTVLEKIGGLDTLFGRGNFEDDDFCIRAALAGFKMRIAWDCFVHHTGGQTFKGAKIDYRASLLRNWELIKAKWAMPKDAALEKGYRFPAAVPPGVSIHFALPKLDATHIPLLEGRCWADAKVAAQVAAAVKAKRKPVAIQLPPCALLGNLSSAQENLRQRKFSAAWDETLSAIQTRPFHPEAFLLLGEIALAAGDAVSAIRCGKHARSLAPDWKPVKKFLNGSLRGAAKLPWLVLPTAIAVAPKPNEPRLSVCLIVRNEEEFLPRCLASVCALASQIVVVDTGSTDRTVEIAKQHGAEVHNFGWCDDFAAARNAALEKATGDWVLVLDADEELMPDQAEILAQEMQTAGTMAFRLPIVDKGREQEGCSYVPRLFRNAPGIFFLGRLHEQAFSSIEARCQEWGLQHVLGKSTLLHYGYMKEVVESRNKVERNLRLLERAMEELPDEPNLVMNLGMELIRSGSREAGLYRYWEAVGLLGATPEAQIVPELRETLLSQLTSHLIAGRDFNGVVKLWLTPLAKTGGMTASNHFGLGLALMELKRPAEAADQMRHCLAKRGQPALSPVNKEILKAGPSHCLALCLWALQEKDVAAQAFAAALAADPSSRRVRFDFARLQAERQQFLEALRHLNDLVAENPGEAPVWELGGQIALSRPEFLEFARDWTGEAMKHFPEQSVLVKQRAEALLLNQDFETALPLWLKTRYSGNPRSLAAVVLCELLAGECQREFKSSEEALVSQELLKWYRQLIAVGAHSAAHQLHERMDLARGIVPGFVRTWEMVTNRVRETMAA